MISSLIFFVLGSVISVGITWHFFKRSASKEGEKKIIGGLSTISDTQGHHTKMLAEIYKNTVKPSDTWYEVDISQYVPPALAKAAILAFISLRGKVKGYVRGKRESEEHPFDTDINNEVPIAVRLNQPKIEFKTVGAVPDFTDLNINCTGFLMNLPK